MMIALHDNVKKCGRQYVNEVLPRIMEEQRRTFGVFLELNAARAVPTEEPSVYLMLSPQNLHAGSLVRLTRDEVLAECQDGGSLDRGSRTVQWLLHQLSTYDCRRQRILALRFDASTVLSEVLRCP